ncbi:MAG TPA: bifunctional phosphoribosylaminoimidazolecarboxamide formyltransferase/IMP cyclohydrolase [bacterium]|nr:bifunctional phosphoribosylaminoimidazolecarboxamide formyltransferase/IMP cyclohydrolase [bacterium]
MRVQRALISLSDKTGAADFAKGLAAAGVEIVSSGGTAEHLRKQGVAVVELGDFTGFPEMLDGRVKTLHPAIHAGLLARRDKPEHLETLAKHGLKPIDLVVVNLYPFESTVAKPDHSFEQAIENIDIGGPTMLRSAAKNWEGVGVVTDPSDYAVVLEEVRAGGLKRATRFELMRRCFDRVAAYDDAISSYLSALDPSAPDTPTATPPRAAFPAMLNLQYRRIQDLRYGENPHQKAAFYAEIGRPPLGVPSMKQHQGKELSYNNILDFDACLRLVAEFDPAQFACVIVKHNNPCGVALADSAEKAFRGALACDPLSAFGGVIAFNKPVDAAAAAAIGEQFYEGVAAPSFDAAALEALSKKKNLRVLSVEALPVPASLRDVDLRRVAGGMLAQSWDLSSEEIGKARVMTRRAPTADEVAELAFAWKISKHVKSNAIVLTRDRRVVGVGAGQMSRVDSMEVAIRKATAVGTATRGAVIASDAFFPFRDGIDAAAKAGVTAIAQPGGSVRDEECIAAANEAGMAMVFTDTRHFRH